MRLAIIVCFGLVGFAALAVHAQEDEAADESAPPQIGDCTPPVAPAVPDGETAPASDIKAANAAVKAFLAAGEDYTTCLDDHGDALGDELEDEQEAALNDAHNAMVDQMEVVAAEFNEALQAYKDRRAAASE